MAGNGRAITGCFTGCSGPATASGAGAPSARPSECWNWSSRKATWPSIRTRAWGTISATPASRVGRRANHRKVPPKATRGHHALPFQPPAWLRRYYTVTGDERFKEISRRFINCGLQPDFWGGVDGMAPLAGAERGHFRVHFHNTLAAARGTRVWPGGERPPREATGPRCVRLCPPDGDWTARRVPHGRQGDGGLHGRRHGRPRCGLDRCRHG